MGRQKTIRFQLNTEAKNVIEPGKPIFETIKGKWASDFFQNSNPIVLELGCGRGEYTVGLAKEFPTKNFIGIDIKGDRLAVGSQKALAEGIENVAFLRTKIQEIYRYFNENEVSELWITFPDPRNRTSDARRRLTFPRFLEMYRTILLPNGVLHLKTDSLPFFNYSVDMLNRFGVQELITTNNLYTSPLANEHFGIKTKYEEIFTAKGFTINYLRCKIKK